MSADTPDLTLRDVPGPSALGGGWRRSLELLYLIALTAANWKTRDWALLVYPFYSLFYVLILVPIGIFAYTEMAIKFHNVGIITTSRARHGARLRKWESPDPGVAAVANEPDVAMTGTAQHAGSAPG